MREQVGRVPVPAFCAAVSSRYPFHGPPDSKYIYLESGCQEESFLVSHVDYGREAPLRLAGVSAKKIPFHTPALHLWGWTETFIELFQASRIFPTPVGMDRRGRVGAG